MRAKYDKKLFSPKGQNWTANSVMHSECSEEKLIILEVPD
jgi:hypothetical protein